MANSDTSSSSSSKFLKYAVGLTSVSAASSGSAAIVAYDFSNASGSGLPLTDGVVAFSPLAGATANTFTEALVLFNTGGIIGGQYTNSLYRFLGSTLFTIYNFGDTIDGSAGGGGTGGNTSITSGYIGFSMIPLGGAFTRYGWAEVTYEGADVTLHAFAYETEENTAIAAGAVPEPANAALAIAAGAAGFAALRRKRRAQA